MVEKDIIYDTAILVAEEGVVRLARSCAIDVPGLDRLQKGRHRVHSGGTGPCGRYRRGRRLRPPDCVRRSGRSDTAPGSPTRRMRPCVRRRRRAIHTAECVSDRPLPSEPPRPENQKETRSCSPRVSSVLYLRDYPQMAAAPSVRRARRYHYGFGGSPECCPSVILLPESLADASRSGSVMPLRRPSPVEDALSRCSTSIFVSCDARSVAHAPEDVNASCSSPAIPNVGDALASRSAQKPLVATGSPFLCVLCALCG